MLGSRFCGVTRRLPGVRATSGCRSSGGPLAAGLLGWYAERDRRVLGSSPTPFCLRCSSVAALVLNVPSLRRTLITDRILAVYRRILPDMSQTEKEAIDAGTVWWDARAVLRQARLGQAARHARAAPHRRGAGLPRRPGRGAVRDDQRLGDHARAPGPAAAGLAVHQGQGLPRHDHPEGVRRPRASPRSRTRRW